MSFVEVSPDTLRIPECPLPRPGDTVVWYANAQMVRGIVKGHDIDGNVLILNQFGSGNTKRYDEVRLADPFSREPPNWHRLPQGGKLLKPDEATAQRFRKLLNVRIPPGPRYLDLVEEIWSRGFETYVVGGTVRDIVNSIPSNDVDVVTTMPVSRITDIARPMFGERLNPSLENGYLRIGASPASGDPFIDVKVFSDTRSGSKEATFGVDFAQDIAHRDFACNALYYEPVNQVIVDPTGRGVTDCHNKELELVSTCDHEPHKAKLFIRTVKFMGRGYSATSRTQQIVFGKCKDSLGCMNRGARRGYFKAQIISKHSDPDSRRQALEDFRAQLEKLGMAQIWEDLFGYELEDFS